MPSDPDETTADVSVLRFSVRILSPTTRAILRRHIDDHDIHDDEFDSSADPDPLQIQSIELCFNADFSSSERPISIRFATTEPQITHTLTPPSLPQPTPPYYIHEIPNILDLTRPNTRRRHQPIIPSLSWCIYTLSFFSLVLCLACLYTPFLSLFPLITQSCQLHHHYQDAALPVATAAIGDRYVLAFSNATNRVSALEKLLPLLRLRFSLTLSLDNVLADPAPDFTKAADVSLRTYANLTSFLWNRFPAETHSDTDTENLLLATRLLAKRTANIAILWRRLCSQHLHALVFLEDVRFALYLIEMAPDPAGAAAAANSSFYTRFLREGLLSTERVTWLGTCHFCPDLHDTPTTFTPSHGTSMPPTPPAWHFACSPRFSLLFPNMTIYKQQETTRDNQSRKNSSSYDNKDAITSFLLEWAASQSARRFDALRSSPTDLDGEPLYPDNQHPFTEADEITEPYLPGEGNLFALVRQLVELVASIDEVVACLDGWGLLGLAHPQPVKSQTDTGGAFAVSRLAGWLSKLGPVAGPSSTTQTLEKAEAAGIAYGAAFFTSLRNDTLLPLVRSLGSIAAGASYACMLSTRLSIALNIQTAAHKAAVVNVFINNTATNGVSTSHRSPPTGTTTINVQYVSYTTDIAGDIAVLRGEFETMQATADREEQARGPRRQQQREAAIKARKEVKQELQRWQTESDFSGSGSDKTDRQSDTLLEEIAEGLSTGSSSLYQLYDWVKEYRLPVASGHEDQGDDG
ncbi:hypothetical protein LY78DRAFT_686266 [Colletotrichum sublineola]|uniref:Uncharacterized protein n=1 Tax=Colletotrichum sublineola TaxID=1173701 RepID=A0A066XT01_COLSU|nr:hypothetical protein LY78DRAFT_686266 [Colletotrichum sublineola]KDN70819.1 hypothetical protein CSUB01_10888 [Colletotrichum sublineola]